jgi:hypothetical protein
MNAQAALGLLIRHGLTLAAGALGLNGIVNENELELVSAAVATVLAVLWSAWQKKRAEDA